MKKKMRLKRKIQKPITIQNWIQRATFYHNKGSGHFLLGIAIKGEFVAGHDLTTHPSLNNHGRPKKKYIKLTKNPNSDDKRTSYVNRKLRKDVNIYFPDSGKLRLTKKKKWKLIKKDKKMIRRVDRNKV